MSQGEVRRRKGKESSGGGGGGEEEAPVSQGSGATQKLLESVRDKVNTLYRSFDGVADAFRYRSRPSRGEILASPLCFCLGNHSSGKSSFLNFLLGRDLQLTGVAPLDDNFTVIAHGERDSEQDGLAVVANNKLPFATLQNIQGNFVEHLRLKMVNCDLLRNITLVDSPGMIDSVGTGRGYAFTEVVRWFAERADLILFLFDPDKPGTTGESLQVFTDALRGFDHKLLLLMNKVDQLQTLSDMSRTFGTLCWNLGKIIETKDLPYLHMTYVPGHEHSVKRQFDLSEFDAVRDDVVKRIKSAPKKHADHLVVNLKSHSENVLVHAGVISAQASELKWTTLWWMVLGLLAVGAGIAFPVLLSDVRLWVLPLLIALVFAFWLPRARASLAARLSEPAALRSTFERLYAHELLSESADVYERTWSVVAPGLQHVVAKFGLASFPIISKQEKDLLLSVGNDVQDLLQKVHKTVSKVD